MIALGVNIDHIATLRQVRGTSYPDPLEAALLAERAGADFITLHLREDRRHIQDHDVERMRDRLATHMNLELAVNEEMIAIACRVRPQDVCLVPERRQELTTEGGLDAAARRSDVASACAALGAAGIRVSLFIDADPKQLEAAVACGAPVVEIHTGAYADAATGPAQDKELQRIRVAVKRGRELGLTVNAGHGLHYENVQDIAAIPGISELNIGHAIVARALFTGWSNAIAEMKRIVIASAAR